MIEYENLQQVNAALGPELTAAFQRVVDRGWYILGQEVSAFEEEFARYVGAPFCVGVANGLDALILSLRALELPRDSEVVVASNTYIATILAVMQAGLHPVLVEPEIETYNIDPCRIEAALTPRTRAICVTHLYGKPCRMDAVMAIAQPRGLHVIEDCAQSHGARVRDRMTGTFGIAGCFSFYPTKNLGALGDAGAVVTYDAALDDKVRHLRNYGSKEKYVNVYPGANSRLDEVQAAILRVKLRHLDAVIRHKRRLAELYFEHLPAGVTMPSREPDVFDVFHIFAVRHPKRNRLRAFLLEQGIKTEVHYPTAPHQQQATRGVIEGCYPLAEEIHATELSLPISLATTEAEVLAVCDAVTRFMESADA